jgi:hypothetical protein
MEHLELAGILALVWGSASLPFVLLTGVSSAAAARLGWHLGTAVALGLGAGVSVAIAMVTAVLLASVPVVSRGLFQRSRLYRRDIISRGRADRSGDGSYLERRKDR